MNIMCDIHWHCWRSDYGSVPVSGYTEKLMQNRAEQCQNFLTCIFIFRKQFYLVISSLKTLGCGHQDKNFELACTSKKAEFIVQKVTQQLLQQRKFPGTSRSSRKYLIKRTTLDNPKDRSTRNNKQQTNKMEELTQATKRMLKLLYFFRDLSRDMNEEKKKIPL